MQAKLQPQSVSLQLVAEGGNVTLSAPVKFLLSNQLFRQIWHFLNFPPVSGALLSACVCVCVCVRVCVCVCCWMLGWTYSASLQYVSLKGFHPEFSRESNQGHCLCGCQTQDREWILGTSSILQAFSSTTGLRIAFGRVPVGAIKPPGESL